MQIFSVTIKGKADLKLVYIFKTFLERSRKMCILENLCVDRALLLQLVFLNLIDTYKYTWMARI